VTEAAEVIEHVAPIGGGAGGRKTGPERAEDALSEGARRVLDGVPVGWAAPAQTVAREAGLRASVVASELRELERRGLVERRGGGWTLASADRDARA
jgi:predicted Rossmann fold nucleotide-binding protein DprA/Smf involved in DNA uptake